MTSRDAFELARELENGAGLAVIADEAFDERSFEALLAQLSKQPRWSEIPFVVLIGGGHTTGAGKQRAGAVMPRSSIGRCARER